MRRPTRKWAGYDYRQQREVKLFKKEWQAMMAAGSTRRMEDQSLLIFDKDHFLIAEVYDKESG